MSIIGLTATSTITLPRIEMESLAEDTLTWRPRNGRHTVTGGTVRRSTNNVHRKEEDEEVCHLEKCCHLITLSVIFVGNILLDFGRKLVQFFTAVFLFCFLRGELPNVYFKPSAMHEFLMKNCKALTSEYRYNPWMSSGWLQTLLNLFLGFWGHDEGYIRKYFMAQDGGLIGIDWYASEPTHPRDRAPILLIIPCSSILALSEDVMSAHAYSQGFLPIVFRKRGSYGIPLTSPSKFQSFGECSDLREVVTFVRKLDPKRKLVSVGVGTGASLLLAYLGEYGSSCHLQAAVCLSPWYTLESQLSSQQKTFSQWVFLQSLKIELFRAARYIRNNVVGLDRAFGSSSAEDYVRNVLSLRRRGENLEDFYEKNEPLREIDEIAIPLLCINSLDDPVVQESHIPFDLFETIPHVTLATTKSGGHCAFLHGWNAKSWALNLATDFCQTVLKVIEKPHLLCSNNNVSSTYPKRAL